MMVVSSDVVYGDNVLYYKICKIFGRICVLGEIGMGVL